MSEPSNAREALIAEAIGDVARLMQDVEALAPMLDQTRAALLQANLGLRDSLGGFENRMSAITENAKIKTVRHLALRTDEAARRSIDQQSRAMADAARVAFGAEIGATMQRWQATLQPLIERQERRWETWLTHTAAAAAAAVVTWVLTMYLGHG